LTWEEKELLREEFVALIHAMFVNGHDPLPRQLANRSVNLLDILVVFLGE
jgi:hypothetical protein